MFDWVNPPPRSNEKKRKDAARLGQYTDVLGLEKNCANLLILGPRGKGVWKGADDERPTSQVVGKMKHKPVTATGSFLGLSADAFLALAYVQTTFAKQGFPKDNIARVTEADLLSAMGRQGRRPPDFAKTILEELEYGAFDGLVCRQDHLGEEQLRCIKQVSRHHSGVWLVMLSELVTDNLRLDFTAYLDPGLALRLRRSDPLAFRIWLYAEAQNLTRSKFAAKGLTHCIFETSYTDKNQSLSIGRLLSLPEKRVASTVARITKAAATVNSLDQRYALEVREDRSWLLVFRRCDLKPSTTLSTLSTTLSSDLSNECSTTASSGNASRTESDEVKENLVASEEASNHPPLTPLSLCSSHNHRCGGRERGD